MSEGIKHQHGIKGCYYGGKWMDVEDLSGVVHKCHEENEHRDKPEYSRSMTHNSINTDENHVYDVIVIGSGCIGASVARELSKTMASVLVLEAADDVSQGATKGNSGIIHAGYDDKPGSVRAKYCWPGNQMFKQLDEELHFGYEKNGSLVVAVSQSDLIELKELYERGQVNGVKHLRLIESREELFALEPHLTREALAALYAPEAGNIIPYEFTIALMENAVDNGVELRLRRQVIAIHKDDSGNFIVNANYWEPKSYIDSVLNRNPLNNNNNNNKGNNNKNKKKSSSNNKLYLIISIICTVIMTLCNIWACIYHNVQEAHLTSTTEFVVKFYAFQTSPLVLTLCKQGADLFNAIWFKPYLKYTIDESLMFYYYGLISLILLGLICIFIMIIIYKNKNNKQIDNINKIDNNNNNSSSVSSCNNFIPSSQHLNKAVSVEEMSVGGTGSCHQMKGQTIKLESYKCKYIVNCAGSGADKIANMIGDKSFKIMPRLGDYLLMSKDIGHLAKHTIFPTPDKRLGKGVLVQTTLWGNLILGPTARDTYDKEHMNMSDLDVQEYIINKCKLLVPEIDVTKVIHGFSGCRAKSDRNDWIIETSKLDNNFINVAGIDSPGLAGSPAIALDVVKMLYLKEPKTSKVFNKNLSFNPNRKAIIIPKDSMWKGLKPGPFGKYTNPKENVICKCEKVTEDEIIEACHRSLPIDSTQAIRKRTRAGMGHCQANVSNYDCEHRVATIISRETGLPYEAVGRRPWPGTSTLVQRWMTEEEKEIMKNEIENAKK